MLSLLADEGLNGDLVRALRHEAQRLGIDPDLVRATDLGLGGRDDEGVLGWAAGAGRVVITQDVRTMIGFARGRVARGDPMAGLVVVRTPCTFAEAAEDLLLMAQCYDPEGVRDQVLYVPFSR